MPPPRANATAPPPIAGARLNATVERTSVSVEPAQIPPPPAWKLLKARLWTTDESVRVNGPTDMIPPPNAQQEGSVDRLSRTTTWSSMSLPDDARIPPPWE